MASVAEQIPFLPEVHDRSRSVDPRNRAPQHSAAELTLSVGIISVRATNLGTMPPPAFYQASLSRAVMTMGGCGCRTLGNQSWRGAGDKQFSALPQGVVPEVCPPEPIRSFLGVAWVLGQAR